MIAVFLTFHREIWLSDLIRRKEEISKNGSEEDTNISYNRREESSGYV